MLKKLIELLNQRPDLAADYLSAYAMLLNESLGKTRRCYVRRAIWFLLMVVFAMSNIVVSSLAIMLWMNMPDLDAIKVLLMPIILTLLTLIAAALMMYDTEPHSAIDGIKEQLQKDLTELMKFRDDHEQN